MRNIFLSIKEALNNIVKHSKATEASLSAKVEGNLLRIEIRDNGIGFDSNKVNGFGNGLNTMKKRLNKFNGSLQIINNKGTKLLFELKLQL